MRDFASEVLLFLRASEGGRERHFERVREAWRRCERLEASREISESYIRTRMAKLLDKDRDVWSLFILALFDVGCDAAVQQLLVHSPFPERSVLLPATLHEDLQLEIRDMVPLNEPVALAFPEGVSGPKRYLIVIPPEAVKLIQPIEVPLPES